MPKYLLFCFLCLVLPSSRLPASGIDIETVTWDQLKPPCALIVSFLSLSRGKLKAKVEEVLCDAPLKGQTEFAMAQAVRAAPIKDAWVASFEYWDGVSLDDVKKGERLLLLDVRQRESFFTGGDYWAVPGTTQRIEKARLMMAPRKLKAFLATAKPTQLVSHVSDRDMQSFVVKELKRRKLMTPEFIVAHTTANDSALMGVAWSELNSNTEKLRGFATDIIRIAKKTKDSGAALALLEITHRSDYYRPVNGQVLLDFLSLFDQKSQETIRKDPEKQQQLVSLLSDKNLIAAIKKDPSSVKLVHPLYLLIAQTRKGAEMDPAVSALSDFVETLSEKDRTQLLRDLLEVAASEREKKGDKLIEFLSYHLKESRDAVFFKPLVEILSITSDEKKAAIYLRTLFFIAQKNKNLRSELSRVAAVARKQHPQIMSDIDVFGVRQDFLKEGDYQEKSEEKTIELSDGKSKSLPGGNVSLRWNRSFGYVEAFLDGKHLYWSHDIPKSPQTVWLGLYALSTTEVSTDKLTALIKFPAGYDPEKDDHLRLGLEEEIDSDSGKSKDLDFTLGTGKSLTVPETNCRISVLAVKNAQAKIAVKAKAAGFTQWFKQGGFTNEVVAGKEVQLRPHPWSLCQISLLKGISASGDVAFKVKLSDYNP